MRCYPNSENATRKSAPGMEPCCTRVQTSVATSKRNANRVLNERAEREKYHGERTPDSEQVANAARCQGTALSKPPKRSFRKRLSLNLCYDSFHRRKCVRTIAGSLWRSRRVRKSIVPNSRSIAGGPQIFAPIARYARNNRDDAVAGGVDAGSC